MPDPKTLCDPDVQWSAAQTAGIEVALPEGDLTAAQVATATATAIDAHDTEQEDARRQQVPASDELVLETLRASLKRHGVSAQDLRVMAHNDAGVFVLGRCVSGVVFVESWVSLKKSCDYLAAYRRREIDKLSRGAPTEDIPFPFLGSPP